jgi:hypothetical protein
VTFVSLGNAARATRAVSSGTGGISIGFSDMGGLLKLDLPMPQQR